MADIKFTVVYDKSVACLELPPTATLAALAELLADRFSEAQPKAIELKLPDADASLRLLDFPEATLDSAGGWTGKAASHSTAAQGGCGTALPKLPRWIGPLCKPTS